MPEMDALGEYCVVGMRKGVNRKKKKKKKKKKRKKKKRKKRKKMTIMLKMD